MPPLRGWLLAPALPSLQHCGPFRRGRPSEPPALSPAQVSVPLTHTQTLPRTRSWLPSWSLPMMTTVSTLRMKQTNVTEGGLSRSHHPADTASALSSCPPAHLAPQSLCSLRENTAAPPAPAPGAWRHLPQAPPTGPGPECGAVTLRRPHVARLCTHCPPATGQVTAQPSGPGRPHPDPAVATSHSTGCVLPLTHLCTPSCCRLPNARRHPAPAKGSWLLRWPLRET